jgi:peptidoglycan hydrolase FlgJ
VGISPFTSGQAAPPDPGFALDVQGLEGLRRAARNSPEEGLKQVSRQFEALFMGMLLKSMRDANPSSGLLESQGGKVYQSLLDQQLAQNLSGRGLKLAEAMFAQLRRTLAPSDAVAPGAPEKVPGAAALAPVSAGATATAARASPAAPGSEPVAARGVPAAPSASTVLPIRTPRAVAVALPDLAAPSLADAAGAGTARESAPTGVVSAVQATVDGFVSRLGKAAEAAGAATGVPAALILAQAALESGWGRREIKTEDGTQSFNLFGIKADRAWRGPVAQATTTEYVEGVPQRVLGKFRAYASYQEAFADYARFLTANPRYAGVLSAGDPAQAAHGLQKAGYATDPQYGAKLVRILQRLL